MDKAKELGRAELLLRALDISTIADVHDRLTWRDYLTMRITAVERAVPGSNVEVSAVSVLWVACERVSDWLTEVERDEGWAYIKPYERHYFRGTASLCGRYWYAFHNLRAELGPEDCKRCRELLAVEG